LQQRITLDPRWQTIHEDGSPFSQETRPSQDAFRTGREQKDVVMGIYKPDGTLAWVSVNATPIFAPGDPVPTTVVISMTDITVRKQMQDALDQASEDRRLAVLLRDTNDAITLHALDGRILAWNPAAQRMYGWTEAEALQMNLLDRVPPEERELALERLSHLGQAQVLEPYHTQRLTKQGVVVEVTVTATALRNEAGTVYAVATTERLVTGGSDD
jgi:two-component system CheB/CheR fusion protein